MQSDRRSFVKQTMGTAAVVALFPELARGMTSAGAEVGVGVVGCGRQGRAVLAELQKIQGVTVRAICDVDSRRLASGGRRARGAEGVDDHRRLLELDGIDCVVVATPTHLHREVAVDALSAGKHVYCEAPLATTPQDCMAIVSAARASGKVCHTGLLARSNPIYKLAYSFFRGGVTSNLISMRAQHHNKTTWRSPSSDPERNRLMNWRLDPEASIGLAGEWGTHQFDVFQWFTGQYPVSVAGSGSVRFHDDGRTVHDTVRCDLTFDDGATLEYGATLGNSYGGRYEVLHGSDAAMKLAWTHGWMFKEADAATNGWEVYANRQQFHNDEGITLIADATKLASQGKLQEGVGLPHQSLHYGLADFIASVTEGSPVVVSPEEAMRATMVGLLAHQAVTTGERVSIDESKLRGA